MDQLGGSRVESVEFDTAVPEAPTVKRWKEENNSAGESRGKKLPKAWNSELRKSGSGAVVVFVDQASMKGAWKEVQRAAKNNRLVTWKQSEGLGIEREYIAVGLFHWTYH